MNQIKQNIRDTQNKLSYFIKKTKCALEIIGTQYQYFMNYFQNITEISELKINIQVQINQANKVLILSYQSLYKATLCINRKQLNQIMAINKPPQKFLQIAICIILLLNETPQKDTQQQKWRRFKYLVNRPQIFIQQIQAFDPRKTSNQVIEHIASLQQTTNIFDYEKMKRISKLGESLCKWVANAYKCSRLYKQNVRPLIYQGQIRQIIQRIPKAYPNLQSIIINFTCPFQTHEFNCNKLMMYLINECKLLKSIKIENQGKQIRKLIDQQKL